MSNVDGTWNVTTNTPMGAQKGTLTLAADGDKLTGTVSSPQGSTDIEGGAVDGNDVSWKLEITSPMPMTLEFRGSVDGDSISGSVKLGSFGNATFEGTRA